jgi:hypothetical protein
MTAVIPAAHWTAGIRALLDHIDEHHLPIPTEIAPDPASRFGGPAIDVRIRYEDMPVWLDSLRIRDESSVVTSTQFGPYARLAWKAVLPSTGVRVDLLTSHQLDDNMLTALVTA